jgi:hypothetical protein
MRQPRGAEPASPPTRQPSWSWADLRSDPDPSYRGIRFLDPPAAFPRPLGSSNGPTASAEFPRPTRLTSGPSPLLQGFHPRSPVSPAPCEAGSTRLSWGFSPFSASRIRGSTHARFPHPASFRPQGFDPLDGFLPANPPDRLSGRSAPGLSPSRGLILQTRRHRSRGPSPPRR